MSISRRSLFLAAPAALAAAGTLPGAPAFGVDTQFGPPTVIGAPPLLMPRGIGPRWAPAVPPESTQMLLVVGEGREANHAKASWWERDAQGWHARTAWPARNGLRGWSAAHREGDLHTPVGVFTLSDAGGLWENPGTRLPYDHSDAYAIDGTGLSGEPLAGTFDHVLAIDYNRVPGSSPLDERRPLGDELGGGIWLHIDHGGPTHGCVTLPREGVIALLRALDPAAHPVVAMGDAAALSLGGQVS